MTQNVEIKMYDDVGRLILQNSIPATYNSLSYNFNINGVAQGIYFLQITVGSDKPQIIKLYGGGN